MASQRPSRARNNVSLTNDRSHGTLSKYVEGQGSRATLVEDQSNMIPQSTQPFSPATHDEALQIQHDVGHGFLPDM